MRLHENKQLFADAINAASRPKNEGGLGIKSIFIEKDYWICRSLKLMAEGDKDGKAVFKGLCVATHNPFRDGKHYAVLNDCQSTDLRKLEFHRNASFASINIAKVACKGLGLPFSISSCKSIIHNAYMLNRFICVSGLRPDPQVIDKLFKELVLFTARAA